MNIERESNCSRPNPKSGILFEFNSFIAYTKPNLELYNNNNIMHSIKYEKLDYRSIPVIESIQVFPRWQTNSLGVTNEKAPRRVHEER